MTNTQDLLAHPAGHALGYGCPAGTLPGESINLVLVMPYRQYVSKAKEEGFRVCSIWDPRLESPEYLGVVEEHSDEFILTDFANHTGLRQVIREAARRFDAKYVYHAGAEATMLLAYEVAEELGKAVNPTSAIRLLNDKLAMRMLLRAHGLSAVRFAAADHWQDVAAVLDGFELPVVVKPTSLAGSRGVFQLQRREDLAGWGRLLESYRYRGPVLVEEYLRGQEYSVETVSYQGNHHVVGVTHKELGAPPLFVEMGHLHPAPATESMRQEMGELTVRLLRLSGYQNGPAHTEIIWTSEGPKLVESQARVAGDRIFRLVELATGIDIERAMFQTVAGRPPDIRPQRHDAARISYFQFPTGVLESVSGLAEAEELDFVHDLRFPFELGDQVPEIKDSKTRHGYVIVSGDSDAQAAEHLERVRALVQVTVKPESPSQRRRS